MPQVSKPIRSFKDLIVWQRAMDLAVRSYQLTRQLPAEERFALADQIRRASASIPANIAEGAGRTHTGECLRGLSIARGSLRELETHLILGLRLGYFAADDLIDALKMVDEIGRLLHGLTASLKKKVGNTRGSSSG